MLTFRECREDDVVTNGTVAFALESDTVVRATFATSDLGVSTGETVDTTGALSFTFAEVAQVDGALTHVSSVLGGSVDQYDAILLDDDFVVFSGEVSTTIVDGRGVFANLLGVETTIFSPTLAEIGVTYANADFDLFVLADGLCDPCTSGCANESLTCVACGEACGGTTERCGIDFNFVECVDGVFGPGNLCAPCASNADCDASDGLSCFPCGEHCSGDVLRCSSSKAFAECEDGAF